MAATYSTLAERLSQIETSITTLQDNISNIKISPFRVVTTLPSVDEAESDVIYFVPSSQTGEENVYDEYALIEGAFEKVGTYSTSVDLSQYVTKGQLEDTNTILSQTIHSIGALKVSKNLDDLGNLDTTVGSIAYYSYIAENPEEISSIKIGENTEASVGKFFMANAIMPTTSGNIVIMFEGDPMSSNTGQDPLFTVTLNADESLENLYATIESNLGFMIPDYFFERFGDDIDFESDGEYCEFPIIKDREITKYGNLILNRFLSLSNRCYISEFNCSDITAFDKVLYFYGTGGVIPFELILEGWRVPESEFKRRISSILTGFRHNDYVVEYVDKALQNITPKGGYYRGLYERAGAVYNEDTGYYELNGLTDITEEQMMSIYHETYPLSLRNSWAAQNIITYSSVWECRTNIPPMQPLSSINMQIANICRSKNMEVFVLPFHTNADAMEDRVCVVSTNTDNAFSYLGSLRKIIGILDFASLTNENVCFEYSNNLEYVLIKNVNCNLNSFRKVYHINYQSLKYLVDNAINTEAITIKVSTYTYSYLTGTTAPSAIVGGTSEEWVTLMQTATDKLISFITE